MSGEMKRIPLILTAVVMFATVTSGYDFFGRARYPGPVRVEGVDLYKAQQQGGPHAEGYQRRVVNWWPRQGVDLIEVKEGMPLRTWTFRQRTKMEVDREWMTRQRGSDQPLAIKAHLVALRGIGNRYAPSARTPGVSQEGDYICPAVVLRLEDGRLRCFVRGTFIKEDEKYILDLYLKEIERVRGTLKKVKYEINPSLNSEWPNNAKPGEPGTMQVVGEHVMFVSGSQCPPGEPNNPWVGSASPERAKRFREGSVVGAEDWWAYNEYIGNLMPYWGSKEKYKYTVTVCGTYRDGYKFIPGYAGGGYGACGLKNAIGGPWSLGLFHEWVHGHAAGRWNIGGGEIQADAGQTIADPAVLNFDNNISRPWRCCMHPAYKTCLFYAIMSQDPNWGYGMALTMPSGTGEKTVFQVLARLGEQRGIFDNGIRGVGDMVGEFTARLAELDCELEYVMRQTPSPSPGEVLAVKRNRLEPIDRETGWYRIFREEAPEPFGSNVVRLVAEKGAKQIRVDFRGLYDPATYGDWRACIVAVGADGRTRYSPLWNRGVMTMEIRPGDRRHWLCVAATPWAFCVPEGPGSKINEVYFGRHAPRYPYEVQLTGCRPGTPHVRPGDSDDYDLVHTGGRHLCKIPHAGDTPEAGRLRKDLAQLAEKFNAFEAAAKKDIEDGKLRARDWHTRKLLQILGERQQDVHRQRDGLKGARHPNGGGWVAESAKVAKSAYVGPDAMVLDGAQVLDNAVIENCAVVTGPKAVVSDHARVSGRAYVSGDVALGAYTRTWHEVKGKGEETLVAPPVPMRYGQDNPDKWKLWANYSLDRDETVVLEDWFRFKAGCNEFHELSLDGTLIGQPKFIVDGEHRGFQFDGKTQYAEAASTLADLGQITVDVALKWDGGVNQVLFDFGSSVDNCFVLYAAGKSGRPELVVTRGGKSQRVVADRALPKGEWTRCRVEIDGSQISLWIDGKQTGRLKADFRPCDAFAPDGVKRNFLAAGRDGSGHFGGTLDFVRVYYTVHEDFAQVPEPRRHSSRRVSEEFIEQVKKLAGNAEQLRKKVDERFRREYRFYDDMKRLHDARMVEIRESTPRAVAARKRIAKATEKLAERGRELGAEFDARPETVARRKTLASRREKLEKQKREMLDSLLAKDKVYINARELSEKSRAEMNRLEKSFRNQPQVQQLKERIAKLSAEARESQDRINNREDVVARRKQLDDIRARRGKLEQEIRQRPELKALQEAKKHREFNERFRRLIDTDATIAKLRREERDKNDAYGRMIGDLHSGDVQLQQQTAQRDAANGEMATLIESLRAGNSGYADAAENHKTASGQVRKRPGELERGTPDISRLNREITRIRDEEGAISRKRAVYVAKDNAALKRDIAMAEKEYAEASAEAALAFSQEYRWLSSLSTAAYNSYYNTTYREYLNDNIRLAVSGGGEDGVLEDPSTLEAVRDAQSPQSWRKRCDWEWRTRWELDGSIAEKPLLREWLEKARGDVLIPKQD